MWMRTKHRGLARITVIGVCLIFFLLFGLGENSQAFPCWARVSFVWLVFPLTNEHPLTIVHMVL